MECTMLVELLEICPKCQGKLLTTKCHISCNVSALVFTAKAYATLAERESSLKTQLNFGRTDNEV
jgi:hypothetical protein